MYSGVATWQDQRLWTAAFSSIWPDIYNPDDWGDPEALWNADTIPFLQPMFKEASLGPGQIVQDIRSGVYNNEINTWLDSVVALTDQGMKFVICPYPEMNGIWTVYGPDKNNFDVRAAVDIYRQFVEMGRLKGLDASKVLWSWAPNDIGWGPLAPYWPGEDVVDIVGGSAYNWGGLHPGEPWRSPAQVLDPYVSEVRSLTGKPIVISQTGAGEGDAETPAWLSDLSAYQGDIEGWIWFSISEFTYQPGAASFNLRTKDTNSTPPLEWFDVAPEPEEPMVDQGRNQLYVKQGMSGQDVEYWQVMIVMAVKGIPYYGNSNRRFIETEAPQLTFKEWDQAMTDYLSAWTGRNSYGVGATERIMIEDAVG